MQYGDIWERDDSRRFVKEFNPNSPIEVIYSLYRRSRVFRNSEWRDEWILVREGYCRLSTFRDWACGGAVQLIPKGAAEARPNEPDRRPAKRTPPPAYERGSRRLRSRRIRREPEKAALAAVAVAAPSVTDPGDLRLSGVSGDSRRSRRMRRPAKRGNGSRRGAPQCARIGRSFIS